MKKISKVFFIILSFLLLASVFIACEEENKYLGFALNEDGESYYVFEMAQTSEVSEIVVPSTYKGKPVTRIGNNAFADCIHLTSITIPDSVTEIGSTAFKNCNNLSSITLPFVGATKDGTENAHFGYVFGASSYIQNRNYIPSSLTTVTITGGNIIANNAFYNCDSLKSVQLVGSVTSIGEKAFDNCSNLENVKLPDSLALIGYRVFSECNKLINIDISANNTAYKFTDGILYTKSGDTLIQCVNKKKDGVINIPDGLRTIEDYAFYNCTLITDVITPNSIVKIGDSAFYGCSGLENIEIGDSIKTIERCAFYGCENLTDVKIGDNATNIGSSAFYGCNSLKSVTLPFVGAAKNSMDNTHFGYIFGAESYYDNYEYVPSSIKTVVITGGNSISKNAFAECRNIINITIPDSTVSINHDAFIYCSSLTSITIGSNVVSVYGNAFYGCHRLIEIYNRSILDITLGSSKLGYLGYYAKNIYSTSVGESKLTVNNDGYVIYADGNDVILVGYLGNEVQLILPSNITEIYKYAFYNCDNIINVTIGDNITAIGNSAFRDCSVKAIYYKGTANQWNSIIISAQNENLSIATVYYYSETEPTENGNYWHYDTDGVTPIEW